MRLIFFAIGLTFSLYWSSAGWSQQDLSTPLPIRIEADRMETSQDQSAIMFSGHVQTEQGNLIINADQMTVHYSGGQIGPDSATGPEAGALTQQIDSISAQSNVKIVQEEWIATGDTMDFNAEKRIIVLSGNATAWQGQNMVSGEKITLYLDEGRSIVERSAQEGERVKAFIYPSRPGKNEGKAP
jgi:lipopolysaccharide export system protein LptA